MNTEGKRMKIAKLIVPDYDRNDLKSRGLYEVKDYLTELLTRAHREDAELVAIPRGWVADVVSILGGFMAVNGLPERQPPGVQVNAQGISCVGEPTV